MKKICIITCNRADWSKLQPVACKLATHAAREVIGLEVIALGSHMLHELGDTKKAILAEFPNAHENHDADRQTQSQKQACDLLHFHLRENRTQSLSQKYAMSHSRVKSTVMNLERNKCMEQTNVTKSPFDFWQFRLLLPHLKIFDVVDKIGTGSCVVRCS